MDIRNELLNEEIETIDMEIEEYKRQKTLIQSKIETNNKKWADVEKFIFENKSKNEYIIIQDRWLTLKNELLEKMLDISKVVNNNFIFKGKLKDMCDKLGIDKGNKRTYYYTKIKEALPELQKAKYIDYTENKKVYTISIIKVNISNTTKILNEWINTLKNYKKNVQREESINWIFLLKVFAYTYKSIESINDSGVLADTLNITKKNKEALNARTVTKATQIIAECKFNHIKVTRKVIRVLDKGKWKTTGIEMIWGFNFLNE